MKNLNEQTSRIKQMMGLNEGEIYKSGSEEHDDYLNELKTVEGTIKYLTRVSEKVDYIAEDLRNYYKGTEFWHYIKPLYSGLKSVSDLQRMHTRTDEREENISYAIEFIKSGFGEDDEEQMEPGDHDNYDDRDYDNGYSHSQQSSADRLDYANDSDDPITRAERRMGA